MLEKYLGPPRFLPESELDASGEPGLVVGLAWTELGGELLQIETSILPGKGKLLLTGQLGEVMKESTTIATFSFSGKIPAQVNIAWWLIRSRLVSI